MLEMIPDRAHRQAANRPHGESDQKDDRQRPRPPRIERFLGEPRRHKIGDVYVLAIGVQP